MHDLIGQRVDRVKWKKAEHFSRCDADIRLGQFCNEIKSRLVELPEQPSCLMLMNRT